MSNTDVGVWTKQGEWMAHTQKPQLPEGFPGVFIGKIWGESCRVCDLLLISLWWGNRMIFLESHLVPTSQEAELLRSAWSHHTPPGGSLIVYRTTHGPCIRLVSIPLRESLVILWLYCCINCLSLLLGTQERPRRLTPFPLQTRNKGHRGAFEPRRVLVSFIYSWKFVPFYQSLPNSSSSRQPLFYSLFL